MSIFNTHKNKAICVLPWVHEHQDLFGKQKPCCWGRKIINNRTLETIRQEMLQGQQPKECNICYKFESEGELSPRITETTDWIKKFGAPDPAQPNIESIHILNDPTCNLKCKTCGPASSTLWSKEKGLPITIPTHNFDKYDLKKLKKINLSGGEPTYNKSYEELCDRLIKENPDCELMITSNLKRLPEKWKEIISAFKNVSVLISCDALNELGCYVRYPLGWSQFEENVKFVSKHANFVKFNLVPSNLVLHKIADTVEWMRQFTDVIHLNQVVGDKWTHLPVPYSHRSVYLEALNKVTNIKISPWQASEFRTTIKSYIEKYEQNNYDSVVHDALSKEIAEQDSHRTTQLKDVDPFLYSWIFAK